MHVFLRGTIVVACTVLVFAAAAAENASSTSVATDRVGLPADYRTKLTLIRRLNIPNPQQAAAVYANAPAAGITDLARLPYPNGAVIVFEWAEARKNPDGTPVVDADGLWAPVAVRRIDVMRREAGYGAGYGEDRAGEWEFASYRPDGQPMKTGAETMACAKCHRDAAARDFVFRGRFPELPKK